MTFRAAGKRSLDNRRRLLRAPVTNHRLNGKECDIESMADDNSEDSESSLRFKYDRKQNWNSRLSIGDFFRWGLVLFGAGLVGSYFILDKSFGSMALRHSSPQTTITKNNLPLSQIQGYREPPARIRAWPGIVERHGYLNEPPELVDHAICGGCRLRSIKTSDGKALTCGEWMDREMAKRSKETMEEAGRKAAKRFPVECSRCDPAACGVKEKKYWPLDTSAPHIITSRSLRLSIPEHYRIPQEALDDLDAFFAEEKNQHPFLFEWNPSIIILPKDQIPDRHRHNSANDKPVYLASFRVSKQQNCFRASENYQKYIGLDSPLFKQDFVDLAGIALLRDDFSILEEGLFDLRHTIKRDQDMRLFVFPPEAGSKESRIYISAFHEVAQLWLRPPKDKIESKWAYFDYFLKGQNPLVLYMDDQAACCTACKGKNFNYFMDHVTGQIKIETLPMHPHSVEEIDFTKSCESSQKVNEFRSTTVQDPHVPPVSFANTDELYFLDKKIFNLPYSPEHGTACCFQITDLDDNVLLVGVSHSKTQISPVDRAKLREAGVDTESRQYMSRFYAFEPHMPYRVVAKSGGFCFPFPGEAEVTENFLVDVVKERPFVLGDAIDCPYITFLSSVSDKAGDDSKVVIAYGLNDCTSRIVEVDKTEIRQMLFDPVGRLEDR